MSFWLPRCVAAVLLCAPVLTLTLLGLSLVVFRAGGPALPPLSAAVGLTLNFIFLFSLWLALYVGFQLTIRWRGSEIERLNALASAQRAELQLLRAKLEPHFLFNALNTISSLVDEDPELTRDAIRRLSNVLRATLTVDALALAPFSTEWAFTRDYLQLEQLRFPHRLRIHTSLPAEIMDCRVPTFSLQTMVENAIKHGINRVPGSGFVEISAELKTGLLCVQVRNGGRLAPPSPESTQIGLGTLRERLLRLCGPGASITLAEEPEGCVTATLVVPQTS
jgi:LytS/YehU family sensor histidine kinase